MRRQEFVSVEITRENPWKKTNKAEIIYQIFKVLVIRMLTLGERIDEHGKNFNKELENIKNNPL